MPPLLEIEGLTKHFPVTTAVFPRKKIAWVKAVDGIDFAIEPGEVRLSNKWTARCWLAETRADDAAKEIHAAAAGN